MAFSCSFSNITETTAVFEASFTGGDANYTGWRMAKLTISDPKATSDSVEMVVISTSKGTGSSNFSSLVQNLKSETEYSWKAEIGYGPSSTDASKITWLGSLDTGAVSKFTASGSFETSADGTTSYFSASEMDTTKYSITFYASFSYDSHISQYMTEANKLTIVYTVDPARSTGLTTLRFDSTAHESTGDNDGIYEWDNITISGLDAGKTYYWKAYCGTQASAGTVTGYILGDSTTLPPEPNALSLKVLPISETKAILTATYYDAETDSLSDYNVLHYKFSTNRGSTWGSYATCTGTVDAEHHFITFQTTLNGLTANANYSYRAYVGSTDPWG